MTLGPSLGAFLGSAFFAFLCAYILFNLSRDQKIKRNPQGAEEAVEQNVKHKFLQLILWGLLLLSLLINGQAVVDMSSQSCAWQVVNETVTGNLTTYGQNYVCHVEENVAAVQYQRLIYLLAVRLIGIYIVLYFLAMMAKKIAEMRRENNRRQGR